MGDWVARGSEGGVEFPVEWWNALRSGGTPEAKAAPWPTTDAEARKRGERTGLDTPVVHAVNDDN